MEEEGTPPCAILYPAGSGGVVLHLAVTRGVPGAAGSREQFLAWAGECWDDAGSVARSYQMTGLQVGGPEPLAVREGGAEWQPAREPLEELETPYAAMARVRERMAQAEAKLRRELATTGFDVETILRALKGEPAEGTGGPARRRRHQQQAAEKTTVGARERKVNG